MDAEHNELYRFVNVASKHLQEELLKQFGATQMTNYNDAPVVDILRRLANFSREMGRKAEHRRTTQDVKQNRIELLRNLANELEETIT